MPPKLLYKSCKAFFCITAFVYFLYSLFCIFIVMIQWIHISTEIPSKRIQNPVRRLNRAFCGFSWRLSLVNYFRTKLHLRCFKGFWMPLTAMEVNFFTVNYCPANVLSLSWSLYSQRRRIKDTVNFQWWNVLQK